jgi:hypothetical protein
MQLKDRITFSFSLIALLLSLLSVYWTTIRRVDDLSVAVSDLRGEEPVTFDDQNNIIHYNSSPIFTFINFGTRPIAVTNITLRLGQPSKGEGSQPCKDLSGKTDYIYLSNEPFVIKPGEIVTQRVAATKDVGVTNEQDKSSEFRYVLEICAIYEVVVPEFDNYVFAHSPIATFRAKKATKVETSHWPTPYLLFHKSGTIFW